jgi:pyridoxamine 5'-phosphate oxidase
MPQYERNAPLLESELPQDPLLLFERWLAQALEAGVHEPTAMVLSTLGADGRPAGRVVLFKGFEQGGFSFYTNYDSRKGAELQAHPDAALTFWWDKLERQVRIEGKVQKLPPAVSDAYFASRPRGSQIGAHASQQSRPAAGRGELDQRLAQTQARFGSGVVPRPPHWGGFCLLPASIEFWQGRVDRMHDRLLFHRGTAGWNIERLQP